jgi:hypothetical protein
VLAEAIEALCLRQQRGRVAVRRKDCYRAAQAGSLTLRGEKIE